MIHVGVPALSPLSTLKFLFLQTAHSDKTDSILFVPLTRKRINRHRTALGTAMSGTLLAAGHDDLFMIAGAKPQMLMRKPHQQESPKSAANVVCARFHLAPTVGAIYLRCLHSA